MSVCEALCKERGRDARDTERPRYEEVKPVMN